MKIAVIGCIVSLLILIGMAAVMDDPSEQPKRTSAPTEAPIPSFKVQ